LLVSNPYWLGLPGSGVVTGFTVLIATYIPASILVGMAAGWLSEWNIRSSPLQPKFHSVFSFGVVILLIGIGLWGVYQRQKDVLPSSYALAARPDIIAAKWLRENTALKARLLVNSFPAFNNYVIVGSDGGWWLPLLAHRQTTVPPINYGFERDPSPDYRKQLNALTFAIQAKGLQDPDVLSQLKVRNISYVYIGQRQGLVNSGGPLFDVEPLLIDPHFHQVYHQDLVWIFQIEQAP
jgi:hypothetical protein